MADEPYRNPLTGHSRYELPASLTSVEAIAAAQRFYWMDAHGVAPPEHVKDDRPAIYNGPQG